MTNNGVPPMPLEGSGNMVMSMSTTTTASRGLPPRGLLVQRATGIQSQPNRSMHPSQIATTSKASPPTNSPSMAGKQSNQTRNRERALNMQRIDLAGQLSQQQKLCTGLEADVSNLQDEITSLRISKETLEAECERLHGHIHDTEGKFKSQTTEAEQREKIMSDKITDREFRLTKILKDLEDSKYDLGMIQLAYSQATKARDQQVGRVQQLELEIKADRVKICHLNNLYEKLQEKNKSSDLEISTLRKFQQSRERGLQQSLNSKDTEVKGLKQEVNTLQSARASAVAEKEAVQKDLDAQSDKFKAKSDSFDELQKSTAPFNQTIVICVDVSGSLAPVINVVKQIYRDILFMIKLNNRDAKVAVIVHGTHPMPDPLPAQAISDATFQVLDSAKTMDTENYSYCIGKAKTTLLGADVGSHNLVILIGDGNANCTDTAGLFGDCERLKNSGVQVHSVVIPNGSNSHRLSVTMRGISEATGGRVEDKNTYFSAINEIFRSRREQYFKTH
ncbi:hypothetical protein F4814DRAFT_447491 [Daldinia grandis]|nr:hypothetical protein F4814DRAFT_447491 [Daldinia grandis]